ncbi:MAG TPA: hypothetical protein VLG49_03855 [Rhabdochlamydiaceae bacterium]|nr:hypothetical protein [Rhabdochlamydiaceae bacterium]
MSLPINNNPNKVILEKVEESKKEGSPERNSTQQVAETVLSKSNKRSRSPELLDLSLKLPKIENDIPQLDDLEASISDEDDEELADIDYKYKIWDRDKGSSIQFQPIQPVPRPSLNFTKQQEIENNAFNLTEQVEEDFDTIEENLNCTQEYAETKGTENKDKTAGS